MSLEIPVISDEDPSRSPRARNPRKGEIDVDDQFQILRVSDLKPRDAVPDSGFFQEVGKCGGPTNLPMEQLKKAIALSHEALLKKFMEENETDDEDSDGSEEEVQHCEVCMKDEEHWSYDCPYLECIPNPEDTPVGEGYIIICIHCSEVKHGHPDGSWVGRATRNPLDSSLIVRKPGVIYHECDDDDILDWLKHGHPDGSWVGRATRNPLDSSLIVKKPGVIYHECDDDDVFD